MVPGVVLTHTKAAMEATKTSTIMPAAPTSARFQRLRNDHEAVASM